MLMFSSFKFKFPSLKFRFLINRLCQFVNAFFAYLHLSSSGTIFCESATLKISRRICHVVDLEPSIDHI